MFLVQHFPREARILEHHQPTAFHPSKTELHTPPPCNSCLHSFLYTVPLISFTTYYMITALFPLSFSVGVGGMEGTHEQNTPFPAVFSPLILWFAPTSKHKPPHHCLWHCSPISKQQQLQLPQFPTEKAICSKLLDLLMLIAHCHPPIHLSSQANQIIT